MRVPLRGHRSRAGGLAAACVVSLGAARAGGAQPRPYVFTVTAPEGEARWLASAEAAYAGTTFQPVGGEGVGPTLSLRAPVARRVAFLARAGTALDAGRARTTAAGELLFTVRAPAERRTYLALGAGAQREYVGTNVVQARVAAGHLATRSRLDANLLLERPLASGRDAIDVVTTLGWMRAVGPALRLGVEAVGQDLEGFWEAEEAEGGARIYVGPSASLAVGAVHVALTAGPVIRSTVSDARSGAPRPLGQADRGGFAVRTAVSYAW